MSKIAIILHAEPGTHDSLGRALHALLYSKELNEEGHEVKLIFDGGGTKWIEEFSKEHKMTPLYQTLKSAGIISGVCDHCVTAFGVEKDLVRKEGLPLVSEYNGHPSIANLVSSGFQIITL